jgi:hypothetical protein
LAFSTLFFSFLFFSFFVLFYSGSQPLRSLRALLPPFEFSWIFRACTMPLHGISATQLIAAGKEYYEKIK